MNREVLRDAIGYWEPRRIWYNAALVALTVAWVVGTWPHFRPALTVASLAKMAVLAALANLCYSAAYLVDLAISQRIAWRKRRWILWSVGTFLALAVTCYWIADEIYPAVAAH